MERGSENTAENSIERRFEYADKIIKEAGEIFKHYFTGDFSVTRKEGVEIVTEADTKIDEFIRSEILREFPDDDFLTEETAPASYEGFEKKHNLWILDPLDGTTNFSRGDRNSAISLSFVQEGDPRIALVYAPMLETLYKARDDQDGAFMNDREMHVSQIDDISESILECDWPYNPQQKNQLLSLIQKTTVHNSRQIKSLGSAALALARVAQGQNDAYFIPTLKPWDVAAASLLIKKAGGTITGLDGGAWNIFRKDILASNGKVHNDLIALFNKEG